MTAIHWVNQTDGDFSNASGWSGATPPAAGDDAILDAPGDATYTVTVSSSQSVASVQLGATAILAITGGAFTVAEGTGAGVNAGAILINGGTLAASGVFDNAGLVSGAIVGGATGLTFTGAGMVTGALSGSLTNAGNLLDNCVIDVSAAGGSFANESGGVVENGLLFAGGNALSNAGLIEGSLYLQGDGNQVSLTNTGRMSIDGLALQNAIVDSSGGTIAFQNARQSISLNGSTIIATGSLSLGPQSSLSLSDFSGVSRFEVASLTLPLGASVGADAWLALQGTVSNQGVIGFGDAQYAAAPCGLIIDGAVSLQGSGVVRLLEGATIAAGQGGGALTNAEAIKGAGAIGSSEMTLTNAAGARIAANAADPLVIATGANTITNEGVVKCVAAGGLALGSASVANSVVNDGLIKAVVGTLSVYGTVSGTGHAAILGGTLAFMAGFGQNVFFKTGAGTLVLAQSQGYTGTISGFATAGGTSLDLRDIGFVDPGEASFSGNASGGVLTVSDGTHVAHIALAGDYLGSTFAAVSDGQGGTTIIDPPAPAGAASAFAGQMAAISAAPAAATGAPARAAPPLGPLFAAHP